MDRENIDRNLPKFLHKVAGEGLRSTRKSPIAYSQQIHSNKIKIISKAGTYRGYDGLITSEDLILFIKSADCIPLFFYFPKRGTIGAIHVGWRSLLKGIISTSLKACLKKLSLSPSELVFFFGAHIRADNYEVKDDFVRESPAKFKSYITKKSGKMYFDLTSALGFELESIGVKRDNIYDCGVNTFDEPQLFSYRKGDRQLFITLIKKK